MLAFTGTTFVCRCVMVLFSASTIIVRFACCFCLALSIRLSVRVSVWTWSKLESAILGSSPLSFHVYLLSCFVIWLNYTVFSYGV